MKPDSIMPEAGSPVRMLLVQPTVVFGPNPPKINAFSCGIEIPLGLMYLSSYIDKQAHESRVLDLRIWSNPFDTLRQQLEEFRPHIVGVTAFEAEILGAQEVAKVVRAFDDSITTVIGGLHASAQPVRILEDYPCFDLVVYGEGEYTLAELLKALQTGKDLAGIDGLAYRQNGEILVTSPRPFTKNLDEFPFPDRSTLDHAKYKPNIVTFNYLRLPTTGIIAGRGCPYQCFHCSKGVWGSTLRYRSAENIFQEILHCVQEEGIRDFRFYDDILTLPHGPIKDLCNMILDNGLKISLNCYSRIDHITKDLLQLMRRAGFYHIKYGIEFGSEHALKLSNRRTTLDQARAAIAMTKEVGIMIKGNFMMGIPGETIEDCEKTISFAKEISPDLVSFNLYFPYAGSKFHKDIVIEGKTDEQHRVLPEPTVRKLISKAYQKFYFRISYPFQLLHLAVTDMDRFIMTWKVLFSGSFALLRFFVRRLIKTA